jgi:hypothetical protein
MTSFKSPTKSLKGYKNSKLAKGESRDCVVRAISAAFDITYNKAHKFVKETYGREDRKGTNTYKYYTTNNELADNGKVLFGKTMTQIGETVGIYGTNNKSPRVQRGNKVSQMTVGTFLKTYPKGTFLLSVRRHSFTIKDGVVVGGNPSDSTRMRVIVKKAWEIK